MTLDADVINLLNQMELSGKYNSNHLDALQNLLTHLHNQQTAEHQQLYANIFGHLKQVHEASSPMLVINAHLDIAEAPTFPSEDTMFIPCKYNTFESDSFSILSKEYHYANTIRNIAICSHPNVIANTPDNSISYCTRMNDHSSCDKYSYSFEILATASVTIPNTSQTVEFQLIYNSMINLADQSLRHVYDIRDTETGSSVNSIVVEDLLHDEIKGRAEAIGIFNEYISSYSDYPLEVNDALNIYENSNDTIAKASPASYFTHILSAV